MLSAIVGAIAGPLVDKIIGRGADLFESYLKKQISIEELRTALTKVVVESFTELEKTHAETLTKTYESFQKTLRGSPELIRMFKVVIYSQTFVLFWSQWVVPMMHWIGYEGAWRAGTTAEWAYLLIGGLCGAAPMLLRAGPGAGSLAGQLKSLIGK
jgi:hypothetical protein